jgi:HK97 family phage portal protein
MGTLAKIASWFKPKNAGVITLAPPYYGQQWLSTFEAGIYVNPTVAFNVSALYACLRIISDPLASAPWREYERDGSNRTLIDDTLNSNVTWLLNTRPNVETTAIAMREALVWSALTYGDGYLEIQRDLAGRVVALWNLDPERVQPIRNDQGVWMYRISQYNGGQIDVPASSIYHLRGPSFTGYVGDSILNRAAKVIAIAAASQQFSASYFANGGVLSGVLETDKKLTDKKVVDRLQGQWAERYAGPKNSGKPLILEEGMHWKDVTNDPDKAQLLETRQFEVIELARFFNIPLFMLNDPQGSEGYGTAHETQRLTFTQQTLAPWAKRHEDEADYKFYPLRVKRVTKIDLSKLTQGDFKNRAEGYSILKKAGILNANEIRAMEDWNSIPGEEGKVYVCETSVQSVDKLIHPPAPPAFPPQQQGPPALRALPGEAPASPPDDPQALVRAAVVSVYAAAFGRYAKKLQNRQAHLEQTHGSDKVRELMFVAAENARPGLLADCGPAATLVARLGLPPAPEADLVATADCVRQGEPPELAADRLLMKLASLSPQKEATA